MCGDDRRGAGSNRRQRWLSGVFSLNNLTLLGLTLSTLWLLRQVGGSSRVEQHTPSLPIQCTYAAVLVPAQPVVTTCRNRDPFHAHAHAGRSDADAREC